MLLSAHLTWAPLFPYRYRYLRSHLTMAGYTPAQIAALLEGPADVAPNGTAYNFDVRPPRNQEGIAVVAVCLTLVTTAVLLRAYSRIRVTKNAFIEDCMLDKIPFSFSVHLYESFHLIVSSREQIWRWWALGFM